MADSFGSSSSENEGTKFVKDGFEQASKWNATSVEVDNNMLKGRRTQRGFTINMGKPEAVQRREKRAQTLPSSSGRRADVVISEEGEKILQAQTATLGARLRHGSVSICCFVLTEEILRQAWDEKAKIFACGRMTDSQNPGDEREIVMIGGDRFPVNSPPAITCIKGCKGRTDKTPNQDNFSLLYLNDGHAVACCMDGHGPFGHIVATQTVQTVPYYLVCSEHYPKDIPAALTEAFLLSQKDVVAKALQEGWDVQASGSTAVCAVWKGNHIWTAHAGDSRIVVGTELKRQVVFETADHKPDTPAEKRRVEQMGGEVRSQTYSDGWTSHRIFVKGQDYPGLCMARTLGDASVKDHGVIAEPEIGELTVDLSESPFLVLASDGVWEFLDSEFVTKGVAKKIGAEPQKTVIRLQRESKKRWKQEEDDYCDDITAVLIKLA